MSLEVIATLICATCGLRATSEVETRFLNAGMLATRHKRELEKKGWMTVSRETLQTPKL